MDNETTRWLPQIDAAIRKYAAGQSREEREDLRQECHLALFEARIRIAEVAGRGGSEEAVKFVSAISRNTVVEKIRGNKHLRQQGSLSDPDVFRDADAGQPPLSSHSAVRVPREAIEAALNKLTPLEQYVVRGSLYGGDKSEEELARELGNTRSSVRTVKKLALKKLRALLG